MGHCGEKPGAISRLLVARLPRYRGKGIYRPGKLIPGIQSTKALLSMASRLRERVGFPHYRPPGIPAQVLFQPADPICDHESGHKRRTDNSLGSFPGIPRAIQVYTNPPTVQQNFVAQSWGLGTMVFIPGTLHQRKALKWQNGTIVPSRNLSDGKSSF